MRVLFNWMRIDNVSILNSGHVVFVSFCATVKSFEEGTQSRKLVNDAIEMIFTYLNNLDPERPLLTGLTGINRSYIEDMMNIFSQCSLQAQVSSLSPLSPTSPTTANTLTSEKLSDSAMAAFNELMGELKPKE
jgi:hypothetical protein